jgi:hypothetical protein
LPPPPHQFQVVWTMCAGRIHRHHRCGEEFMYIFEWRLAIAQVCKTPWPQ